MRWRGPQAPFPCLSLSTAPTLLALVQRHITAVLRNKVKLPGLPAAVATEGGFAGPGTLGWVPLLWTDGRGPSCSSSSFPTRREEAGAMALESDRKTQTRAGTVGGRGGSLLLLGQPQFHARG